MSEQPPAGRWWAGLAVAGAIGGWVRRVSEAWRWPLQVGSVGSGVLALASVVALVWTGVLALAAVRHLCARGWTVRIRAP